MMSLGVSNFVRLCFKHHRGRTSISISNQQHLHLHLHHHRPSIFSRFSPGSIHDQSSAAHATHAHSLPLSLFFQCNILFLLHARKSMPPSPQAQKPSAKRCPVCVTLLALWGQSVDSWQSSSHTTTLQPVTRDAGDGVTAAFSKTPTLPPSCYARIALFSPQSLTHSMMLDCRNALAWV